MPRDASRFVVPIVCGAVSEGLIVVLLWRAGGAAAPAALLLVLEAMILGFVFGSTSGTVGTLAPVVVFGVVAVAVARAGDRAADLGLIVFMLLLLGFAAWFVGSLRARYGAPRH
ncbi:MAG TPA: hypothetical protein VGF46_05440 [Gaiellales bacterium]|jgi:hypothetical protein